MDYFLIYTLVYSIYIFCIYIKFQICVLFNSCQSPLPLSNDVGDFSYGTMLTPYLYLSDKQNYFRLNSISVNISNGELHLFRIDRQFEKET